MNSEVTVTMNEKGQTTLPSKVRKALGLKGATKLTFRVIQKAGRTVVEVEDAVVAARLQAKEALHEALSLRDEIARKHKGAEPVDVMEGLRDE
jgi:bifunctional DNA-binding transcriptional regulator/antitoxin component of YhaV-PrlF toxin-antitoxin module